jgi:hypothetical protein
MPGHPLVALSVDAAAVTALAVEVVGAFAWSIGLAAAVATTRPRFSRSPWVDRGLSVGLVGLAVVFAASVLNGHWPVAASALLSFACCVLLREQLPARPERRMLLRSVSGVVARLLWRLSKNKSAFTASVVRVERPGGRTGYTLAEIRRELAGHVLMDATADRRLDNLIEEIADEIESTVLSVGRIEAEPSSVRYGMAMHAKINDFANAILAQATRPGAHRVKRPYGPYSGTALTLAAACRLAERHAAVPVRV